MVQDPPRLDHDHCPRGQLLDKLNDHLVQSFLASLVILIRGGRSRQRPGARQPARTSGPQR